MCKKLICLLSLVLVLGFAGSVSAAIQNWDGGGDGADNNPLHGGKSRMFEGEICVPCIVRWPGVIAPGTICDEFLTAIELFPMLCRVAGLQPPKSVVLDGFDMTQVLAGKKKSPRVCRQHK